MNGSTSAIPPLCGGLGAALTLVLYIFLENFESNTTCGCDKVSRVPQSVFVIAPTLGTVAFEEELG
jgi:hypothetical protein